MEAKTFELQEIRHNSIGDMKTCTLVFRADEHLVSVVILPGETLTLIQQRLDLAKTTLQRKIGAAAW